MKNVKINTGKSNTKQSRVIIQKDDSAAELAKEVKFMKSCKPSFIVNIRQTPNGTIIGGLYKDNICELLQGSLSDEWVYIRIKDTDIKGYVMAQYLEEYKEEGIE